MKQITVIKFGGSLSKDKKVWNKFLDELAGISKKNAVVLVHGGGPEVNTWLEKLNIKSRFINGLRYTDEKALEVVEMVLSGKVNKSIVAELLKRGVKTAGLSGKDGNLCISKRIKTLGFVGEPEKINKDIVLTLLKGGYLPVISSMSIDPSGQTLNTNADSMAMGIASSLKARKLVLLTDVPGVLDKSKRTIPKIKVSQINKLIKSGVITGGMIPKIKACAYSIKAGVREVWIASGVSGIHKLKGTIIVK